MAHKDEGLEGLSLRLLHQYDTIASGFRVLHISSIIFANEVHVCVWYNQIINHIIFQKKSISDAVHTFLDKVTAILTFSQRVDLG